ncbi:MAG: 50S ribosome-binding GTPase [Candidatus Diapherotrites archaeon]|nr:50S ribosome-binding GTPase [Candidatus Diapherotrites archaeon]
MTIIQPVPKDLFRTSLKRAHNSVRQMNAKNRWETMRIREAGKVQALGEALRNKTSSVVKGSADFDELPPFHKELIGLIIDVDSVRKSLHSVGWAGKKAWQLSREYARRIRSTRDVDKMTALRKQFDSRAESIFRGVNKDLEILHEAYVKLRNMPSLKDEPTVIIAGYPNVGKSSILRALSGSGVEVQPYPFTTKQLLVGHMKHKYMSIQLVDTPGVMDRPVSRMNSIELQALAAMRHLSDKVLFIFDPSETCGYSMQKQKALFRMVKKNFSKDVLVVYNKADLVQDRKGVVSGMWVSTKSEGDVQSLRIKVAEWALKH